MDIWSFGIIFYEMLVRVNHQFDEWDTVDRQKYENVILSEETNGWRPSRPADPNVDITTAEWEIVESCWQYLPEER